jgi:hypothetical protein
MSDALAHQHPASGGFQDDDLLSPFLAAAIAERSVRTIRRAYANGTLIAYRDGGGRGVRIRYGDLRDWLLSEPVATPVAPTPARPLGRIDPAGRDPARAESDNQTLLNAAREKRRRRPAAAAARLSGDRRAS